MATYNDEVFDLPVAAVILNVPKTKLVRLIKQQLFDANIAPVVDQTQIARDAIIEYCVWRGKGLGPFDRKVKQ
jgi:hypothetical protein